MASVAKREWTHKGERKSAWIVRYLDPGGRHRQKTFEKKKEADRYRTQVETELRQDTHAADADKLTVRFVAGKFDDWMAQRQKDGRIGMTHYYRVMIDVRNYVLPLIGDVTLRSLTLARLTDWQTELLSTGRLSPVSVRTLALHR